MTNKTTRAGRGPVWRTPIGDEGYDCQVFDLETECGVDDDAIIDRINSAEDEAFRFYKPGGTYTEHDSLDEVRAKRIEAADRIDILDDLNRLHKKRILKLDADLADSRALVAELAALVRSAERWRRLWDEQDGSASPAQACAIVRELAAALKKVEGLDGE